MAEEVLRKAGSEGLNDLILSSPQVEDFLTELAGLAAADLSGPGHQVYCGITLVRRKKAATVATSDPQAKGMDELQYLAEEGPCLSALQEGVTVHLPNLEDEVRWPEYTAAVAGGRIKSVLAVPLLAEGTSRAVMNLYSEVAYGFAGDSILRAEEFALHARSSLQLALRIAHLTDTQSNLAAALESRTTIDLAAGVIMGENRCSQEAAMTILKNASSSRNIKLRDVATAVVASVTGDAVRTHFDA